MAWWQMLAMSALLKWRQEDQKFKVILDYGLNYEVSLGYMKKNHKFFFIFTMKMITTEH